MANGTCCPHQTILKFLDRLGGKDSRLHQLLGDGELFQILLICKFFPCMVGVADLQSASPLTASQTGVLYPGILNIVLIPSSLFAEGSDAYGLEWLDIEHDIGVSKQAVDYLQFDVGKLEQFEGVQA